MAARSWSLGGVLRGLLGEMMRRESGMPSKAKSMGISW